MSPAEPSGRLTIRMPPDLHKAVREIAERRGESLATVLREMIRCGVAAEEEAISRRRDQAEGTLYLSSEEAEAAFAARLTGPGE